MFVTDRNRASHKYYLGYIDLKEGKIDSARYRLEEMNEILQRLKKRSTYFAWEREVFYSDLLLSEIRLAENLPDATIAILEEKSPLDYMDGVMAYIIYSIFGSKLPILKDVLARSYYENGDIERAIEEYETLTTFNPNRKGRDLIHPKYHYRLAKLYEEKGLSDKAIERYEKFLDIWKDADEDLPEKQDAKVRLARLKGNL